MGAHATMMNNRKQQVQHAEAEIAAHFGNR